MKQQMSIRVSGQTRAKLEELATSHGTQTEVIAIAIDCMYREEKGRMEHLWVIEWKSNQVPSAALTPDLDSLDVVVADTHFAVVRGGMSEAKAALQGFPYWRLAGHPSDGRWIGQSGDEVYIAGGKLVDSIFELAEALGMTPAGFDGATWQDVDEDVLRDSIPQF